MNFVRNFSHELPESATVSRTTLILLQISVGEHLFYFFDTGQKQNTVTKTVKSTTCIRVGILTTEKKRRA